jgi:hypothetical protein
LEEELKDSDWRVDEILKRRDALIGVLHPFMGATMDPELADGVATVIESRLGWFGTKYPIRNTLVLHTGTIFHIEQWRQIAWQISANEPRLRHGIPLAAFSPTASAQWIAAEIIGVAESKLSNGKPAVELEFRALTGVNAGFSFKEVLTPMALYVISRDVGYNQRNRYDENPLMFFGMRLAVKLADGRIDRFFCTDKIKSANRKMIRYRRRDVIMPEWDPCYDENGNATAREPLQYGCPHKFDHNCWECPKTTDFCLAAYK